MQVDIRLNCASSVLAPCSACRPRTLLDPQPLPHPLPHWHPAPLHQRLPEISASCRVGNDSVALRSKAAPYRNHDGAPLELHPEKE